MIKSFRLGAAGAAIVAALGMSSMAHAAAQDTATAQVEILGALTLTADTALDFGQIAVNGAGTATLNPTTSNVTCTANLICVGTPAAADFTVTGTTDATVGVTLPTTTVTLNGPNGDTISLASFTTDSSTVTLTGGSGGFSVGGQLTIANGISAGNYSGTFNVSVEYN
ncbi:MAG: DUF4402 domain-containing protein [Novosphingobium sp.]|nr:DUF4402 domain-containing protein [Novosphingobium sp.]